MGCSHYITFRRLRLVTDPTFHEVFLTTMYCPPCVICQNPSNLYNLAVIRTASHPLGHRVWKHLPEWAMFLMRTSADSDHRLMMI